MAIKRTADGKIITKGGLPSCACCCSGLPIPVLEIIDVHDRDSGMTHAGNVQSSPFPASYLECFIPKCQVIGKSADFAGSKIDDFGIIGGVIFDNNTPCSADADGEVTTVLDDTDVAVTIVANKINVAWSAASDSVCGGPTGLGEGGGGTPCRFKFYWVPKP